MLIRVIKYCKNHKKTIKIIFSCIVICLHVNCSKVPKITDFDVEVWKNDQFGCEGNRLKLAEVLEQQRHELKMIEEPELKKILGTPNSIQIMQRQQRYYIYWIQNPAKCLDTNMVYKELKIRVSALGKVTEVLF